MKNFACQRSPRTRWLMFAQLLMLLVALAGCGSEVDRMLAEADQLKVRGQWRALDRKVKQINQKHPACIDAWIYRQWNLAYNLADESSSLDERYAYVQDAIDVLIEGSQLNPDSQKLYWHLGWTLGHKLGRARGADVYFRIKFRDDEYLHERLGEIVDIEGAKGFDGRPHGWLVARLMFVKAVEAFEQNPSQDFALSPLILYSEPAMASLGYAEDIVAEGECGDIGVAAWKNVEQQWLAFGEQPITREDGTTIRLSDAGESEDQQRLVASYRLIVNYDAVLARCRAEQRDDVRQARRAMFDARLAALKQDRGESLPNDPPPHALYDAAFGYWANVFAVDPPLANDIEVGEDVYEFLQTYRRRFLGNAPLPKDFPLREMAEHIERQHKPGASAEAPANE